jgi:hypothetical protein
MKKDLLPLGGTAGAGHPLRVQGRRKLRMPIRSLVCSVSQKCFIAGLGRLIHGVALALVRELAGTHLIYNLCRLNPPPTRTLITRRARKISFSPH